MMKSTVFTGDHMVPQFGQGGIEGFRVPTLPAYATEYAELTLPPHLDAGHIVQVENRDFMIEGDFVRLAATCGNPLLGVGGRDARTRLVIHYHGIRDYSLLFPQVKDPELRKGLALFYEESQSDFDAGAWLSFTVMAAAVYEGLLRCCFSEPNGKLWRLAERALESKLITGDERKLLDAVRLARNHVHLSHTTAACVSRAQAMDMRRTLDRLVRALSVPRNLVGTSS